MDTLEIKRPFCWRCVGVAVLPLLATVGFLWIAGASLQDSLVETETSLETLVEESDDILAQNADLRAQMVILTEELEIARAAALAGGGSPEDLVARLEALPAETRAALLEGARDSTAAGLAGALERASDPELSRYLDALPSLDVVADWFAGLDETDRAAWIERLPGARDALVGDSLDPAGDPQSSYGVDGDLIRRFRALEADRDALRDERDVLIDERDQLIEERDALRRALDDDAYLAPPARPGGRRAPDEAVASAVWEVPDLFGPALSHRAELVIAAPGQLEPVEAEPSLDAAASSAAAAREADLLAALGRARDGLASALTRAAAAEDALLEAMETFGEEAQDAERRAEAAEAALTDAERRAEAAEGELADAERALADAEGVLAATEQALAAALGGDDGADGLESDAALATAQARISALEAAVVEAQRAQGADGEEREAIAAALRVAEERVVALESALAQAEVSLAEAEEVRIAERLAWESAIDATTALVEDQSAALEAAEAEAARAAEAGAESADRIATLEATLADLERDLDAAEAMAAAAPTGGASSADASAGGRVAELESALADALAGQWAAEERAWAADDALAAATGPDAAIDLPGVGPSTPAEAARRIGALTAERDAARHALAEAQALLIDMGATQGLLADAPALDDASQQRDAVLDVPGRGLMRASDLIALVAELDLALAQARDASRMGSIVDSIERVRAID